MTVRTDNVGKTRITDSSGRQRTATHLSTNIIILVESVAVGAISTISISEKRSVKRVNEVGADAVIDSAPNQPVEINGSCDRTRFDGQRIAEAFMRGYVHVAAQRTPFDIEIQDNFKGGDAESVIVTTIRNVWITGIDYTYSSSDFIIVDRMSWLAESIDSVMGSGANVVGAVNSRGIPVQVNQFEATADRGLFRGALDAPGLLQAFSGSNL